MVRPMATSPPLEAFTKATRYPLEFSSFVSRVFLLVHQAAKYQSLNGMSICRGCPTITHLFFADDNLLFCKANTSECMELINILNAYEKASGQKINEDKSSVFFSSNTPSEVKEEISRIHGPMQDTRHKKYLGLPLLIGTSKN